MNFVHDIITYVRRIIKSPSNAEITDELILDYINRFYINDVDARMQLFDLKTKYQFKTSPTVDQYNMPLYDPQLPDESISMYPVYQGFCSPAYINGIQVPLETLKGPFFNAWPNVTQNFSAVAQGDGGNTYVLQVPLLSPTRPSPLNPPLQAILRGHVDMAGIVSTGVNQDPPFGTTINTQIPLSSIKPSVYISTTDAFGNNITIQDSGQFMIDGSGNYQANYGLLMQPGKNNYYDNQGMGSNPFGYTAMPNGYVDSFNITGATQATQCVLTANNTLQANQVVMIQGVLGMSELNGNTYTVVSATPTTVTLNVDSTSFTAYTSGGSINALNNYVDYLTGTIYLTFPTEIPSGNNISVQTYFFQTGLPRSILFYNNTLTLRSPPDRSYLVEMDAYLSPSAFLSSEQGVSFAYMSEYLARGAARKILSDTGDVEQFMFYEPLFKEQEMLVWKRSQRQWSNNRTPTIYSMSLGNNQNTNGYNGGGYT